jgi:hypothetical protein
MYRTSVYRRQARAKAIRRKKFYAHATGWIYTQTGHYQRARYTVPALCVQLSHLEMAVLRAILM